MTSSARTEIPPKRFSSVFCAANAMAMPPMPRPASTVVRLKPSMPNAVRMAGGGSQRFFGFFVGGECDGKAADGEAGEHGGQVEAQYAERGQDGDDHHQRCEQSLAQHHQGSGADAARADGMDAQTLHRDAGGAEQQPE